MENLDLKLCRSAIEPWGFRIAGGADLQHPLIITKVIINFFPLCLLYHHT